MEAVVVGYDPGGQDHHGVCVVPVVRRAQKWLPQECCATSERTLASALAWLSTKCDGRDIVGLGVDSLTEWNDGDCGYRPADRWLKAKYPGVQASVVAPNSLMAMAINGAAFLISLESKGRLAGAKISEAHPKVVYYALQNKKYRWPHDRKSLIKWAQAHFKVKTPQTCLANRSDTFDACVSAFAALAGLNGAWTLDLHKLPTSHLKNLPRCGSPIRFIGETHFYWP